MKQLLVQLDDRLAAELERRVPARSRGRSEFVRRAIQRALDEEVETQMAAAYAAQPDREAAHFDASSWDAWAPKRIPASPTRTRARRRP